MCLNCWRKNLKIFKYASFEFFLSEIYDATLTAKISLFFSKNLPCKSECLHLGAKINKSSFCESYSQLWHSNFILPEVLFDTKLKHFKFMEQRQGLKKIESFRGRVGLYIPDTFGYDFKTHDCFWSRYQIRHMLWLKHAYLSIVGNLTSAKNVCERKPKWFSKFLNIRISFWKTLLLHALQPNFQDEVLRQFLFCIVQLEL